MKHQEQGRSEVRARRIRIALCLACAFGILVFYLLFGILQEDITKDGYGEGYPDGPDYWVFMITLVWVSSKDLTFGFCVFPTEKTADLINHKIVINSAIQITTTMNTIISKVVLLFFEKSCSFIKTEKLYLSCGFFNCASLILTNKSLQYVSYPVQVLGKACRPIPVIIFSALIAKKFHSLQKWIGRDSLFCKPCWHFQQACLSSKFYIELQ